LAQRLADGDSADAELRGERVLPELFALGISTIENAIADGFNGGRGECLASDGVAASGSWLVCRGARGG
jgi:hypothetical protein